MASFNSVHILGNLARDPEVKYTPKGTAICNISVAINRKYKADNDELREEVTFVEVVLFGRTAEVCNEYCKKGAPILVDGRLKTDSWDDKETGKKRYKMIVVGENIQLLGGKREGEQQSNGEPKQKGIQQPKHDPDLDVEADDIPFS